MTFNWKTSRDDPPRSRNPDGVGSPGSISGSIQGIGAILVDSYLPLLADRDGSHGSFRRKRTGKGRERGKRETQQIQTDVLDACSSSKVETISEAFTLSAFCSKKGKNKIWL